MKIFAFVICLLASLSLHAQASLKFVEEYIDFKLDEQFFEINGVFLFHNPQESRIRTRIEFPFATEADSLKAIRVFDLNKNERLKYTAKGKSIYFIIEIEAKDTLSINIAYKQPAKAENVYIITSTQAWGKPLEKAKYSLKTAENRSVKNFSYNPDYRTPEGIYIWEKTGFMPEKDFIVTTD